MKIILKIHYFLIYNKGINSNVNNTIIFVFKIISTINQFLFNANSYFFYFIYKNITQ